jgi:hypothetical protein
VVESVLVLVLESVVVVLPEPFELAILEQRWPLLIQMKRTTKAAELAMVLVFSRPIQQFEQFELLAKELASVVAAESVFVVWVVVVLEFVPLVVVLVFVAVVLEFSVVLVVVSLVWYKLVQIGIWYSK